MSASPAGSIFKYNQNPTTAHSLHCCYLSPSHHHLSLRLLQSLPELSLPSCYLEFIFNTVARVTLLKCQIMSLSARNPLEVPMHTITWSPGPWMIDPWTFQNPNKAHSPNHSLLWKTHLKSNFQFPINFLLFCSETLPKFCKIVFSLIMISNKPISALSCQWVMLPIFGGPIFDASCSA